MGETGFQYSEAFLQWIWKNRIFDHQDMQTECGKSVEILEVGELNHTDGPDFSSSRIAIGDLIWYGDVELHLKSKHWYEHGHEKDPHYNNVILHVIATGPDSSVTTQDGNTPYTLILNNYLSRDLKHFLMHFQSRETLPCQGNVNFISDEVFYKQLEKAHSEYLEKKTDDFLSYYDPNILPSKAWKKALIISIWDGLGISHNRMAMQRTARRLLLEWEGNCLDDGLAMAWKIAGFSAPSDIQWNLKAVRPANHPEKRIKEAVSISYELLNMPFESFLEKKSFSLWDAICETCEVKHSNRMEILYGTVFLPAIYTLGMLYSHQGIIEEVRTIWSDLRSPIPGSLLKKFKALDLNDRQYRSKLGSIHQLKSYCRPRKCSECFVLKNAIQS